MPSAERPPLRSFVFVIFQFVLTIAIFFTWMTFFIVSSTLVGSSIHLQFFFWSFIVNFSIDFCILIWAFPFQRLSQCPCLWFGTDATRSLVLKKIIKFFTRLLTIKKKILLVLACSHQASLSGKMHDRTYILFVSHHASSPHKVVQHSIWYLTNDLRQFLHEY